MNEKQSSINKVFSNYKTSEDVITYDSFDKMELDKDILRGIYSYGFEKPSPVQKISIKPIIEGRHLITQSHSGTGKTATFMIGILHKIDQSLKKTQALVIAPTRELANQIYDVYKNLSSYTNVTGKICIGGTLKNKYSYFDNINEHIIIGTPGRISDLIAKNIINNEHIKILVVDEADDVLSISFQKQIIKIFSIIPKDTQICLFSATIPDEMFNLTDKLLKNPIKILVEDDELSLEGITQYYVYLGSNDNYKFDTLCDLYDSLSIGQAMIYCNKRYRVEELSNNLREQNFAVSQIHGDMLQKDRQNVMKKFRDGTSRILISTDVLSRGIDVQQVSLVINYDIPKETETYIHRIGRSGRYGRKGVAINFVTDKDNNKIRNIEKTYKVKIEPLPNNIKEVLSYI